METETQDFVPNHPMNNVKRDIKRIAGSPATLLIAEKSTVWRDWVRRMRVTPALLVQKNSEGPSQFAERVRKELARLADEGSPIRHAAFFPGNTGNEETIQARFSVGVHLASYLAAGGGGVLLLRAGSSHRSLENLAAAIRYTVEGSDVFVITTEGSAEMAVPQ